MKRRPMHQNLMALWKELELAGPEPTRASEITHRLPPISKELDDHNQAYAESLIRQLYSGVAFIVRNAAPPNFKETMLEIARHYERHKPEGFYKMVDGTPNFHRIIDDEITKKYSLYAIKHSYYFYNWNINSDLEKHFKEGVYRFWRYVKLLAGNTFEAFEKNIPSDGQIDRLQIVKYPQGGVELREHVDPGITSGWCLADNSYENIA